MAGACFVLTMLLVTFTAHACATMPKENSAASPESSLQGRHWKAIELAGIAVPSLPSAREPHLEFQPDGRVSGADGCNRVTGSYTLKGEAITFGALAGTRMACTDTAEIERRFQSVIKGTGHWRITNGRLELMGATGKPLAVFERQ